MHWFSVVFSSAIQNTTPLLSPANSSTTSTIFLAVFSSIFQGQNTKKKNLGFRLAVKLNITLQEYTIDVLTLKTDHLKECYYYTTNEI